MSAAPPTPAPVPPTWTPAGRVGRLGITALSGRFPAVRLLQGCLAAQPVAFILWYLSAGRYPVLVLFAVAASLVTVALSLSLPTRQVLTADDIE